MFVTEVWRESIRRLCHVVVLHIGRCKREGSRAQGQVGQATETQQYGRRLADVSDTATSQ